MSRLVVITASTRPGRVGAAVTEWFMTLAVEHGGFEVQVADLAVIDLPFLDESNHPSERDYQHEHTRRWSNLVDAADAFVFVMPEYNRGFTAPLKNALDFLYDEWAYKPVGFVSYGMTSAGLRAVEMIMPIVCVLRMVPIPTAVSIPLRQRTDENGALHPDEVMEACAKGMLDDLVPMSAALLPLRRPVELPGAGS